ncbi:hypothetical protein C4569_04140, partial [Candidatus Parcubacteria bacterium]
MKDLLKSIDKKEWRFVLLFFIITAAVTTLPYFYGIYATPGGMVYNGNHFLISVDYPVYSSYIWQASQGRFLFSDFFSAETTKPDMLNTIWLFPGMLTAIFGFSPMVSFHISRILLAPFLIVIAYLFISYLTLVKSLRKLILTLFTFGSGWGFYFLLFDYE